MPPSCRGGKRVVRAAGPAERLGSLVGKCQVVVTAKVIITPGWWNANRVSPLEAEAS